MKNVNMCCVNFNGQFVEPKNLSKKAYKAKNMLEEVLHTKIDGKSNSDLIKKLPFDVFIYCNNPTQKAINPKLSFYIETEETPKQIGLWSLKHLKFRDENKAEKLRDFILNFNKAYKENKGVLPLKNSAANGKIGDLIVSGFFNKK